MSPHSAELAPKPARIAMRETMAHAVTVLPSEIPTGAARTLAARWIVLRDAAGFLLARELSPSALPPPPEAIRRFIPSSDIAFGTPIGLESEDESLSATFRLGEVVQRLLEWSIGPDGSPRADGRIERRATGAFYTPPPLVDRVVSLALDAYGRDGRSTDQPMRVCDPACGSGNFLAGVAAAARGGPRVLRLEGADLDPLAAWAAEAALSLDGATRGALGRIRHGDALVGPAVGCEHDRPLADAVGSRILEWPETFDLVVGNPPFLGQLSAATARSRTLAAYLKHASRGVISGYADAAAAFVWRSVMLTAPGGVVALIVPRSILAARDAASLRRFVDAHADVVTIEAVDHAAFDAGIQPCIVVMQRRDEAASACGGRSHAGAWRLADVAVGGEQTNASSVTLGSICSATADFRDAYYGLREFVVEDEHGTLDERLFPRLITSGMIEPGRSLWGQRQFRLFKQLWARPRVDLARMQSSPSMHTWALKRLVPKVLVATQTRAIECVADERGEWLPVTPVISVIPREGVAIARIMESLAAPGASEAAARIAQGTGMSAGVFRLTASQIGQLPLSS